MENFIDRAVADMEILAKEYPDVYQYVTCPVCGNTTLNMYYVCPHCGWEHDNTPDENYPSAANGNKTIAEFRAEFNNK